VINRIDTALEAEEFKHMQNMLEPLNIDHIGMNQGKFMRDRERAAYTKIDQYNSNPGTGGGSGQYGHPHAPPLGYNNGSQSGKMKHNQYDPV